jgi:succinate-semialdehyde dehydrogenase/glutarate-semialdehyde dehydrogenase
MKRCTMELGGHAPVIVAEDADVELAVKSAGAAKLRNAGQVCISPTRFLVHQSLQKQFTEQVVAYFASIKVGNGLEADSKMGPLANPRRVTAMQSLVANAQDKGAKLLMGGQTLGDAGNFYAPTILADVPLDAEVFNNEPFGPMIAMRSFDKLEEAIAEANRLPYGLAAYAFTASLKNAHLLSQHVESGMLWINQPAVASAEMPFGGVKDSGYGSEGGTEALEAYLIPKAVSIAMV